MKKKVLVVTGSRAEYGLLRSTIDEIRKNDTLTLRLLATGMHTLARHGMTMNEIKKDDIPLAAVVTVGDEDDMLTSLTKVIQGIRSYCLKERPDLIVVLGDRDEPFAGAIVGGHLKIPVAHIHGGDVTGFVVDEYIRHSITKFSHLHFTVSAKSAERVLKLGEEPSRIFVVGAPGLDRIREMRFESKETMAKKYGIDSTKDWFMVVHHPASLDPVPFQKQIHPLLSVLDAHTKSEKIVVLPNSDTGSDVFMQELGAYKSKAGFHFFENITRDDYLNFLAVSSILIGNSSSGVLEGGYLKLPVVDVGSRQAGRERGRNVLSSGYERGALEAALVKALSKGFRHIAQTPEHPYGEGFAGKKIVDIIVKKISDPNLFYKRFTYA